MPDPNPRSYLEAQIRARARMGSADFTIIRGIQAALQKLGLSLETDLSQLQGGDLAVRRARDVIVLAYRELDRILANGIGRIRDGTFEEILGIWETTGQKVARDAGLTAGALAAIRPPVVPLLGAYDALDAANSWKTLLRGHAANAAREANQIVRLGLLEGVNGAELGRRLRFYVQGSRPFHELFEAVPTATGTVAKLDLRRLPVRDRGRAREMVYNARRIGVTESHNARAEAELQFMLRDPFIAAFRWRLSPDRGPTGRTDECDALALNDFFGLGPGIYPLASAPMPPHPHDRCEKGPITRGVRQANQLKANPARQLAASRIRVDDDVSPERLVAIQRRASRAVSAGRRALILANQRAAA